jgi:two-component system, NarL family, response regulator LiaR
LNKIIRVLIADDHAIVRQVLCALLDTVEGIEVVAEAGDGEEAVRKTEIFMPDLILLDLMMPRKVALEVIPQIRRQTPQTRILVLTTYSDDDQLFQAIKAGAHGYVLKEVTGADLVEAIRNLYAGKAWLHPAIARKLIRELNRPTTLPPADEPLTDREAEVLVLVARGLSTQEIADQLVISVATVHAHTGRILHKLSGRLAGDAQEK